MDSEPLIPKHARVADIARLAGVGTATVDRVLNGRGNVRDSTRQRVIQAKAAIETGTPVVDRNRPWRLKIFLPGEAGPSTEYLAQCFQEFGARGNATIECVFTTKMEPGALARKLRACEGQGIDAVAFQALEDQRVRDAVDHLKIRGIPCLSLISSLANSAVIGFVGTDSRAAGRTAGLLMGRLCQSAGLVAIISGGQYYRSHENREMGFRAVVRKEFPHLQLADTISGQDDIEGNYNATCIFIEEHPDLLGIYSVGGGNEGIVRALQANGVAGEVKLIGHNLTAKTQAYLLDGSLHYVLHQNMRRAAELAVQVMIAELEHQKPIIPILPTEIITRENILGTTFG
ncbi:LacI family DNA-binding transcriptional regulator [Rhodobacteraceae bacterium B1Z28]|uniref:LacI family DNA-binding transcriptional regulator n=1 Tax=Ruegeria haliotis TaxID=2747601 RepID=A0ABX2PUR6_9RHOB|nr:LacI family DNA-binding transcriptional regulator [Ruegeria haliotis]NVO57924.1 LacI family DNA-binding transcriptional regulator [Ruegeria haliotis]